VFHYTKRTLILEIVTIAAALVLLAPFWILIVGAFKTGDQILTTSSFAPRPIPR
jgi:raffinose/stachyose/melibiose transport system permease protein